MVLVLFVRIEEVLDGVSVSKKKVVKGMFFEIKIDNYSFGEVIN